MKSVRCISTFVWLTALLLSLSTLNRAVHGCPFCRPVKTTFTQDIAASDIAALAELVERPEFSDVAKDELPSAELIESYKATFRIKKVYKGSQHLDTDQMVVALYTGSEPLGTLFLLRGVEPDAPQWAPPLALSERAQKYVEDILSLPDDPADRLRFFEDYLDDSEEILQADAYDEFARADYDAVKAIKDDIDHDRLIGWIKNPKAPSHMRSLYFTMLSVCGQPEDIQMLEEILTSGDRDQLAALSSMASCYLTLTGAAGLPLIEDHFLRGGVMWDPEYVHTYGAIMALRFLGEQGGVIDRGRILQSLRIMLDRPQLADLVIRDLARWEDWESMPRLVELFQEADEESSWVRVPVINYLRACPLPEAKDHIEELSKIDPGAVQRASSLFPFPAGGGAASQADPAAAERGEGSPTGDAETVEPAEAGKATWEEASEKVPRQPDQAADQPPPPVAQPPQEKVAGNTDQQIWVLIVWIVVIPLLAAAVLFGLMWLILRRPREPLPTEHH